MIRASRVRSSFWKVSNKLPGKLDIWLCNFSGTWPRIHGYLFVCKVLNHLWLYFLGHNASDSDPKDLLEDSWAILSRKSFSWCKLSFRLWVVYWSTFTSFALCFLIFFSLLPRHVPFPTALVFWPQICEQNCELCRRSHQTDIIHL